MITRNDENPKVRFFAPSTVLLVALALLPIAAGDHDRNPAPVYITIVDEKGPTSLLEARQAFFSFTDEGYVIDFVDTTDRIETAEATVIFGTLEGRPIKGWSWGADLGLGVTEGHWYVINGTFLDGPGSYSVQFLNGAV